MNESNVLENNTNVNILTLAKQKKKIFYLGFKRIFDIVSSLLGLIILLPIFIIVCILIKLEDGGAPIYTQDRIGKNGKIFKLYKFRSMIPNADEKLFELLKNDKKIAEEYKINKKLENDPRITKVGKIIRRVSIDELPQLINILKGDMSLIGNRPYLPREKNDMGLYYNDIIKSKPGLTGLWQTSGRSNISFSQRLKIESKYSKTMSLKLDIKIFFLTFYVVLFGKGAR